MSTAATLVALLAALSIPPPDPSGAWREIADLVRARFHDPALHGLDWDAITTDTAAAIARDPGDGPAHIRAALAQLADGHTRYFTPYERAYYELLDVFHPDGPGDHPFLPADAPITYVGIGVVAVEQAGRTFAADVYPGGPADEIGVRAGDELVSANGGPWGDIRPFLGRADQPTPFAIRRTSDGPVLTFTLTPRRLQPRALFLAAIERDARLVWRHGRRLGYVRARSHAHPDFIDAVKSIVLDRFREADGLVFDMRGGWGGMSTRFLELFHPAAPTFTQTPRGGAPITILTGWPRPVVAIIDGGSRSSKEVLAHAFTRMEGVRLVGTRTSGAVTGGRPYVLGDGSLLYLGVADVAIDGVRLEGVGVPPDVEVARPIPYARGADPQIDAAFAELEGMTPAPTARRGPPNVVIVMTDDQGYGDAGFLGNPVVRTPHTDALAARSARLANFYVSPVCSPTRAALMTGRYGQRTTAVDPWIGRAMLEPGETTIAECLSRAGWATGVFGKWHLGDCAPMRAIAQGFDTALVHRGGGIGQPSDPWGAEGKYTDAADESAYQVVIE